MGIPEQLNSASRPDRDKERKEANTDNNFNQEAAKLFFASVVEYIRRLVNLHEDTDHEATVNNIYKDVEFRGGNVWMLFFAIIIASVGLNVNSTAVIIGAMLVSPLMGPIMGLGLAVGIYDMALMRKSLRNLFTMVAISLLASTTYFLISPLSDAQSELLARTQPTIFDVFIAFFGGMAGIIAQSRRQEKITAISGVAIATALMPPLCTAGYGLGTGQFIYFIGAFYLFFINSFFIALATFVAVRYLQFPKKQYVDRAYEKRVRHGLTIMAVVVIVPSVFIAISVVRESSFNNNAIKYVADLERSKAMEDVQIINSRRMFSSKGNEIILSVVGRTLDEDDVEMMQERMSQFNLKNTKLVIKQAGAGVLDIESQAEMLQNLLERKDIQISERDSIINDLRNKLLLEQSRGMVGSVQLAKEVSVVFPQISELSLSKSATVNVNSGVVDSIPVVNVRWEAPPSAVDSARLSNYLKARLNSKRVDIYFAAKR